MSGAERPRREGVGKMGQQLDHPRPLGREENTRDCPETGGGLTAVLLSGRVCSGQWGELSEAGPTACGWGLNLIPTSWAHPPFTGICQCCPSGQSGPAWRERTCRGRRAGERGCGQASCCSKKSRGNQGSWQEPGVVVTFGAQKHFS